MYVEYKCAAESVLVYLYNKVDLKCFSNQCLVKFPRHHFNLELVFQVFTKSDFKLNWFSCCINDR